MRNIFQNDINFINNNVLIIYFKVYVTTKKWEMNTNIQLYLYLRVTK